MLPTVGYESLHLYAKIKGYQGKTYVKSTPFPCPPKCFIEGVETGLGFLSIVSGAFGILLYSGVMPIGVTNPALLFGSIGIIIVGGVLKVDGIGAFAVETIAKKRMFPSLEVGEYTYKKNKEGIVFFGREDSLLIRIIFIRTKNPKLAPLYYNELIAAEQLYKRLGCDLVGHFKLASERFAPTDPHIAKLTKKYFEEVLNIRLDELEIEEESSESSENSTDEEEIIKVD